MRKIAVISVALLCTATISWSQGVTHTTHSTVYVPTPSAPIVAYKYHDGTALLTDGTTLTGRFQYNGRKVFTYRASSQAARQRLGFSTIRRLALAGSDTLVTDRTDSTIFVRMDNHLLRQLARGSTMVLDQNYAVDEDRGKIGRRMFVLDDNGDLHKFTSLQKLNKWFYAFREKSGKKVPDAYLNESEIVKAVARFNDE